MASKLPLAVVFGGSGFAGMSIVSALIESKDFRVKIPVRPSSTFKPSVTKFLDSAPDRVSIVPIDIGTASPSALKEVVQGAEVVLCTLVYDQVDLQKKLVDICVQVGTVKRFVPSDWASAGVKGVRWLFDKKLEIREYVKNSGLGYTFIDTGFWHQVLFRPLTPAGLKYPIFWEGSKNIYNGGTVKTACTDHGDMGRFVARIIKDPRTLNQYVFVWAQEVTQSELQALTHELGDPNLEVIPRDTEYVLSKIAETKAANDYESLAYWQYHYSLWILGENIASNAVKPEFGGALDAKVLYPDMVAGLRGVRESAVEYFAGAKQSLKAA